MNAILFGALTLLALSRLLAPAATSGTVGQVAALVAIAATGYALARSGRVRRRWSVLAYAVAWVWLPVVPLVALWVAGAVSKKTTKEGVAAPVISPNRRRLSIAWVHELGEDSNFIADVHVHGDRIGILHSSDSGTKFWGLSLSGSVIWQHTLRNSLPFGARWHRHVVYTAGRCIRKLSMADGQILAEDADPTASPSGRKSLYAKDVTPTAVVYGSDTAFQGRDPDTLELLWEVADPEGLFIAHQDRLCAAHSHELVTVRVPSLEETRVRLPDDAAPNQLELHTHHGDLWCQFSMMEGGRRAIDIRTGEIAWSFADPPGYGASKFDDHSAYMAYGNVVASYDLRTGVERWRNDAPVSDLLHLQGGRLYAGDISGKLPGVLVIDATSGAMLLHGEFDYPTPGYGSGPKTVVPLGEKHLLVGMRFAVVCLEIGP